MEDKELCIHMVTIMAADDLAMHGTRPSADMLLAQLSHNIEASTPENWILYLLIALNKHTTWRVVLYQWSNAGCYNDKTILRLS